VWLVYFVGVGVVFLGRKHDFYIDSVLGETGIIIFGL